MKPASLSQLKHELKHSSKEELVELCLSLTKYKKENKELLTYLLFEASDEASYVKDLKAEIDDQFLQINSKTPYLLKKNVRKILRDIKKYIRYSKQKQTEVELLIYYCRKLKEMSPSISRSTTLQNIYDRQVELIVKSVKSLHEDLQFDFEEDLKNL
jgi:hypothetical protein